MENNKMNQFFNDFNELQNAQQPEQQAQQPAQQPFAQQLEQQAQQPIQQPFAQQPEQQAQQPIQQPFAQQPEQQAQQPIQQPFAQQPEQQAQQPIQQPFAQQPEQQAQQPIQQPFAQQPEQQAQQPIQQPFAQTQQNAQSLGFNQVPNMNNTKNKVEITPEMKKKFVLASNIAVVSGALLTVITVIRIIINFLVMGEANKIVSTLSSISQRNGIYINYFDEFQRDMQTEVVFGFILLAIAVGFTVLAYFVRTTKSKAIAINLIVFSSIFIFLIFIGLISSGDSITKFNTQITLLDKQVQYLSGKDRIDFQNVIQSFKNLSGLATGLIFIGVGLLIGWTGMLVGGILRVSVKANKPVVKW